MLSLADFRVGDHLVQPSLGQIVNGDEPVHVEPRSIEVLVALAERNGEVWPKTELIRAVWGEAYVSDEVLTHAIWDLRKAFGDDAGHPRYIQTIPKRGYRLIAPVEPVEPEPDLAARPNRWSLLGGSAVLLVALLALVLSLRQDGDPPTTARTTNYDLVVVSSADRGAAPGLVTQFDDALSRLAGTHGMSVRVGPSCPEPSLSADYCLRTAVHADRTRHQASAQLIDLATGELVWSPPLSDFDDAAGAIAAGEELGELTAAYFEALDMRFFTDRDIEPWFEVSRHDVRAVRDFLAGAEYVYRHEVGGRGPLDLAAARDPDFIAPRVWRIQTLSSEREQELLDRYLADLDRLEADAHPFERAMIFWGRAAARGDVPRQIRHLDAALHIEPGNRPVTAMLGTIYLYSGDAERAWQLLEPLAKERWEFLGLYAPAGRAGLLAGQLERAEEILELALELTPVDPEVLALLELLAIYRGDPSAAQEYRRQLQLRIELIRPEPFDFDRTPYVELLAAAARSEGRAEIADELQRSTVVVAAGSAQNR